MISVPISITADNSDLLAATQLDQVPDAGLFDIILASTQADTDLTVTLGQDTLIDARPISQRTNGQPDLSNDPSISIASPGGVRPVINVNIVTGAVVRGQVSYASARELQQR